MKQSGKTMGMVIASLRKAQGMTQAELAAKMQVTDKAVSKWERDLSCPDIQSLPRLAEILEVSVEELMQGETRPASSVKRINEIVDLVLKALEPTSGFQLAGLGLASAGILFLRQDKGIR